MKTKLRNQMIQMLAEGKHKMDVIKYADSQLTHLNKREANKMVDQLFAGITKDEVNKAKLELSKGERVKSQPNTHQKQNNVSDRVKIRLGKTSVGDKVYFGEVLVTVESLDGIKGDKRYATLKRENGTKFGANKNCVVYLT